MCIVYVCVLFALVLDTTCNAFTVVTFRNVYELIYTRCETFQPSIAIGTTFPRLNGHRYVLDVLIINVSSYYSLFLFSLSE